jgi:recombination protein RecA
LDVRRTNMLKRGEDIIGTRTRVRVVKNKLAPPFRQAEFDVLYGRGISRLGELFDLALQQGLIVQNGSWFAYQATKMGQGREQAKAFLQASTDFTAALELQVRQNLGLTLPTLT